jgi:hypothetical protein
MCTGRRQRRGAGGACVPRLHLYQLRGPDAGQRAILARELIGDPGAVAGTIEIVGGPTPIRVRRVPGEIYRWKVQNGSAEQHVYVQIADSLTPESVSEPLRSEVECKGETVLRRLLQAGEVPVRIKITSAGVTKVGIDRRSHACEL